MPTATAEEQLLLELLNEARLDPMANAERYLYSFQPLISLNPDVANAFKFYNVDGRALYADFIKLQAVGPLAWSDNLASSAESHSNAMIAADEQSHQVSGEADLAGRLQTAGYSGYRTAGENVYAFGTSVIQTHAAFMVDWGSGTGGVQSPPGHRNNIMSANFTEVGIDVTSEKNTSTEVGPYVVTQDFGSRGKFFITGAAFTDNDLNDFYSIGEGRGDLTVSGGGVSTTSGAAGGYSLAASLGPNVFTLSGAGLASPVTVTTTITDMNLKLDVMDGNTLRTSGSITVTGPIKEIEVITVKAVSITAGEGRQQIWGNDGDDTLNGGAGDDEIYGGAGNDNILGGDGNDLLRGENGYDVIDGGGGIDTAIYRDAAAKYGITAGRGGSLIITGDRDSSDTVSNVEFFRFADGQYRWDAASASMVLVANTAPVVAATQSLTTGAGAVKQFTVTAVDPDGDALLYTAGRPVNGTVTPMGGGIFTYTPKAGYTGLDSFTVTASDGRGGTAVQTINFNIAKANTAPTVAASQSATTDQGKAKQVTVSASDADGDQLTYTAANASHGTITGGSNGIFTYTPASGYSGIDSFAVTVSDGKGGTATQVVSMQIAYVVPPPSSGSGSGASFQLYAANGLVDAIGGTGAIVGTNAFQDVTVLGDHDRITFDGSFNRGGDIIRLPGVASDYAVVRTGGIVEIRNSDSSYLIPLGESGISIVFGDGVRKLFYDGIENASKIGNQVITNTAAQILAPTDHSPLPTGQSPTASGRIYLMSGSEISVGGDHGIFGTSAAESIHYLGGDLVLDGSFNKGGDTLYLPDPISEYQAYRAGSVIVLMSNAGNITIPVGEAGMALNFDGETHILRYDAGAKAVTIGDIAITSVSPTAPDVLFEGGLYSLDIGSPAVATSLSLDAGTDYILTDNANVGSNVIVHGFDLGDMIQVTGAPASEYNFINGDGDNDGVYGDLVITYNANNVSNSIAILNAFDPGAFVASQHGAEVAIGGQFITFG